MADALKFVLELVDRMSGPARQATAALQGLDSALKGVNAAKGKSAAASQAFADKPIAPDVKITSKELDVLKTKLRDDTLAVTNLSASMRALQQASVVDADAFRKLQAQLQKRKDDLAAVQTQLIKSGKAAEVGSEGTNRLTTTLRQLAEGGRGVAGAGVPDAVEKINKAVENLTTAVEKLTSKLGGFGVLKNLVGGVVSSFGNAIGEKIIDVARNQGGKFFPALVARAKLGAKSAASAIGGLLAPKADAPAALPSGGGGGSSGRGAAVGVVGGSVAGFAAAAIAAAKFAVVLGGVATAGTAAAAGVTALTTSLIAVPAVAAVAAAALGGAITAGEHLAIKAAAAKRDNLAALEAAAGTADAASEAYSNVRNATRELDLTMDDGQELARSLLKSGVKAGGSLSSALAAVTQAGASSAGAATRVQGVIEKVAKEGKFDVDAKKLAGTGVAIEDVYGELAERLGVGSKQIERQLRAGKVSVEVGISALSGAVDRKFGALARSKAFDPSVQLRRLGQNIKGLFEDVDTSKLLEAASSIVEVFDEGTKSGEIMKGIVTQLYDRFFEFADDAVPFVRLALKGLLNVGLNVLVGLKPLFYQLGIIGPKAQEQSGALNIFGKAFLFAGKAARTFAEALSEVASHTTAMKALGVAIGAIAAFAYLPITVIGAMAYAVAYLVAHSRQAVAWLGQLYDRFVQAGSSFIDGLIVGIESKVAVLAERVKSVATGVVDAFRRIWKEHSPSRVMMGSGVNLMLGVGLGIQKGAPAVNAALARAVALPRIAANDNGFAPSGPIPISAPIIAQAVARGAAGSPQPAGGAAASGREIHLHMHLERGAVTFTVSGGVDEIREHLTEVFADAFEQAAVQAGLAPTGT